MIKVNILDCGVLAGTLEFDDEKYIFAYDEEFLRGNNLLD